MSPYPAGMQHWFKDTDFERGLYRTVACRQSGDLNCTEVETSEAFSKAEFSIIEADAYSLVHSQ